MQRSVSGFAANKGGVGSRFLVLLGSLVLVLGLGCGSQVNSHPPPPPSPTIPLSGLELWLRGDVGVTSSNGRVSLWEDQSGKGRHAAMSNPARQPYLVTGALNGQSVIRFNGAESLGLASLMRLSRPTLFVVARNNRATNGAHMILGPADTSPNHQLRFESGNQALFVTPSVFTSSVGDNRVYHALSVRNDGTTWSVFRDGNLMSTHASSGTGTWDLYQVGAWYSDYFLEGDIAEIIAYDRALTEGERDTMNSYLQTKYNLP